LWKSKKSLSEISIQCSVAQSGIAKYFDKTILLTLRGLLDSFIDGQPET
jgi:hypothetical protein